MNTGDPHAVMSLPAPEVPADAALAFVARHFGLDGELRRLESERDQNFRTMSDITF